MGPALDSAITDKGDKPLRDIALVDVELTAITNAHSEVNQERGCTRCQR